MATEATVRNPSPSALSLSTCGFHLLVQCGCFNTGHHVYIFASGMEENQRKSGFLLLGSFLEVSQETHACIIVRTSLLAATETEKCVLGGHEPSSRLRVLLLRKKRKTHIEGHPVVSARV